MTVTRIAYRGWQRCFELTNNTLRLVITGDVGPRIIHCGLPDGQNILYVDDETAGLTGGDEWHGYGGHRLWHAPEAMPRTYQPDNDPVAIEYITGGVRVVADVEATTGIQKQLEVTIAEQGGTAYINHCLQNCGQWPVKLAPWALTMMTPGGVGIAPLPPRGAHPQHLLPNTSLTLWAYTDMSDPRWAWGREIVLLRQQPDAAAPQKIGVNAVDGWLAYAVHGLLFVKTFNVAADATYPDRGSAAEMFTNGDMLELESLGPLITLAPDKSVIHAETWHLYADCPPVDNEQDVIENIQPLIAERGDLQ